MLLTSRLENLSHNKTLFSIILYLVVFVFYLWTASNGYLTELKLSTSPSGYHGALAEAFLHGQLHLMDEPSSALLNLPNPYDPSANEPYRKHDASLYNNHYYLYFTPIIALFILAPFKVITGYYLSEALFTALLCFVGFLVSCYVLNKILKIHSIKLSSVTHFTSILLLASATSVPFLLRRPIVYESSIAAAYAMLMLACNWFVNVVSIPEKKARNAWVLGIFIGLVILSRPNQLLACLIFGLGFIYLQRVQFQVPWTTIFSLALKIIAPVICIIVSMMYYNYQRYGSVFEFGSTYQLAGYNPRIVLPMSFSYLPPNIFNHLFQFPKIDSVFPYLYAGAPHLRYVPHGVNKIYNQEPIIGLLGMPIFWLGLFSFFHLKNTYYHYKFLTQYALVFFVVGMFSILGVSLVGGCSMRYAIDYTPALLLSTLILFFTTLQSLVNSKHTAYTLISIRIGKSLFIIVSILSILIAFFSSLQGCSDDLKRKNNELYRTLRNHLSLGSVFNHQKEYQFSVDIARLAMPAKEPIFYIGKFGQADLVALEHKDKQFVRIYIEHWARPIVSTPWVDKKEIAGKTWHVYVHSEMLIVRIGKMRLISYQTPYKPRARPVIARNDIWFTGVTQKAISDIRFINDY